MLATAESTSSIHSLINSAHAFKEIIHVTPPNKEARRDVSGEYVYILSYADGP